MFQACLGLSWVCLGHYWVVGGVFNTVLDCLKLSWAVLEARKRFWRTVARFQVMYCERLRKIKVFRSAWGRQGDAGREKKESWTVWGCLWQVLDRRGQALGRLGLSWAGLGWVLGGSWAEVGVSRAGLGLLG